jgi:hypothetical protein
MRALGVPFLHVQLATPDERALPPKSNARSLTETLRHAYPADCLSLCVSMFRIGNRG